MIQQLNYSISDIHKAVCYHYDLNELELFKRTRYAKWREPRQLFHYLCRNVNSANAPRNSLYVIARYFSEVTDHIYNHATVINSLNTIQNLIDVKDPKIMHDMSCVIKILEAKDRKNKINFKATKNLILKRLIDTNNNLELKKELKTCLRLFYN